MSDEEALKDVETLAAQAEADEGYTSRCIAGEKVFFYPYTHGLAPGHIYSELGVEEFKISKSCEYHFDLWTAEPEDFQEG